MNVRPDPAAADRAERAPSALAGISATLRGFAEGETALARRRDLRELHDRLSRQIAASRGTPGAEPAPDAIPEALADRLAALEAALLRVEAAVHVDLDRHVTAAIGRALDRRAAEDRRHSFRRAAYRAAFLLAVTGLLAMLLLAR